MQPEDSDREAVSRSQTKFRMTVDLKFNYSKKYERERLLDFGVVVRYLKQLLQIKRKASHKFFQQSFT